MSITALEINGVNRITDLRGGAPTTIQRLVNAVGSLDFTLDNNDGTYDGILDIEHQLVLIKVDGAEFWAGHLSRVTQVNRVGKAGRWVKTTEVRALDQAEELLFFDDFEKVYNQAGQTLDDVLDDIFNEAGLDFYHLIYQGGQPGSPEVGYQEKKEGQSLLAFIQQLHRGVGYIFYVDDSGILRSKPITGLVDSGVTLNRTNLIGDLDYTQQDSAKLYNWIKLYGKNPMFDGYTDGNALGWGGSSTPTDDPVDKVVGNYSLKVDNTGAQSVSPYVILQAPVFNYPSFDLSKDPLVAWFKYTGGNDTRAVRFQLYDGTSTINFYSGDVGALNTSVINQTNCKRNRWCIVQAPVGKNPTTDSTVNDKWWPIPIDREFNWKTVMSIRIGYESETQYDIPDTIALDGLVLPFPCIATAKRAGYPPWGTATHRRPLVDTRADIRNQSALQVACDTLLAQHQLGTINAVDALYKLQVDLRYAGLLTTLNFPAQISNAGFYASQVTHTFMPHGDAGKGHSSTTRVQAVNASGAALDHSRLGPRAVTTYSPQSIGMRER